MLLVELIKKADVTLTTKIPRSPYFTSEGKIDLPYFIYPREDA